MNESGGRANEKISHVQQERLEPAGDEALGCKN